MKKQTEKKIIKLYKSGLSQSKVGKLVGYHKETIGKVLRKYRVSDPNRSYRKHEIKVNFFDTWSHDMAYILGFITADGSVNRHTLSINLSQKDRTMLTFICSKLGEVPLEKNKKLKSIRIRFNSVQLLKSLEKYNILPNKTSKIRIDFDIPKKFLGDYIRGVFDGDGWVSQRPGKRHGLGFGICSASEQFINDLHKLCKIGRVRCRLYENDPARNPQFYLENFTNADAIAFRNLIYKHNSFSLKRKKKIFFSRLT